MNARKINADQKLSKEEERRMISNKRLSQIENAFFLGPL